MGDRTLHEVAAPVQFPAFPFKPYQIQLEFMTAVYHAIEKGGVGIVESPTGTGKTLSLICSALQWLKDQRTLSTSLNSVHLHKGSDGLCPDEPAWIRNFSHETEGLTRKGSLQHIQKLKRPGKHGSSVRSFLEETPGGDNIVSRKKDDVSSSGLAEDDDSFLPDDYQSDDDRSGRGVKRTPDTGLSSSSEDDVDLETDEEKPSKVFFCSRTHSQLSQFIKELQRTEFSSSLNVVSVGSRKTLCINPDVNRISSARVNERCLELQKGKTIGKVVKDAQKNLRQSKTGGCPFLRKQKLQRRFREELLEAVAMDIEDLVQLGTKLGTCPYYGSRQGLPSADLVVLPYQSLLHAGTRESLGLNLKDSVVIIDEAHNLVDTVSNMYSCQLSLQQLKQVHSQLSDYLAKFRNRLASSNRRYIETLLVLAKAFLQQIESKAQDANVLTINEFLFSLSIDNINICKLRRYIKESNIVNKVSSYGEKLLLEGVTKDSSLQHEVTAMSAFRTFADFILALENKDSDGRVLVKSSINAPVGDSDGFIKFIMLNAAKHFAEVVEKARAVILAGGTLQPVTELRARLFPHLSENQLHMFSCGHIVPPESILPIAVGRGPAGKTFDFTFQSRGCHAMVEELGRFMSNICSVVPEGVVVFFPSFDYEHHVFKAWKTSGILASIEKRKRVFREPRNTRDVEVTLENYKASIKSGSPEDPNLKSRQCGAVLLCVVGGKMSEGINFSDGMGRCVVMVGLPYPSPGDPELVERMKYIDQMCAGDRKMASREYYENLCMKAVNQSIGRAIRHIGDYAAVLLVDARYLTSGQSGPVSKIAGWIRERLVPATGGYADVHRLLHQFFRHNQSKQMNGSSPPVSVQQTASIATGEA